MRNITHPVEDNFPISFITHYSIKKVPQEIMSTLSIEVDKIQNNFDNPNNIEYNPFLAGQIDREFALTPTKQFSDYIMKEFDPFIKSSPTLEAYPHITNHQLGLTPSKLWVNFQKKHEYNPIHFHNSLFSYVIWYKVPYDYEVEKEIGPGKNITNSTNGVFNFIYSTSSGLSIDSLRVDKKWEGYMVMFPSDLHHLVYPFYSSDEYRISIAGNIDISNISLHDPQLEPLNKSVDQHPNPPVENLSKNQEGWLEENELSWDTAPNTPIWGTPKN